MPVKQKDKAKAKAKSPPAQHQQRQPGRERKMTPRPKSKARAYKAAGKLAGKTALITGGDSGIGRAVAVMFAKEGSDVAIVYLEEHRDANETRRLVEAEGRRCVLIDGDVSARAFCERAVDQAVRELGGLDVLVNNAGVQYPQDSLEQISDQQLERTFRVNIFAFFYMTRAALRHIPEGGAIVNSTSVTAYRGSSHLIDYASTKGAIVAFTRALANNLVDKGIRVNAVAPGPIWTPLIPASFEKEQVAQFGAQAPMKRPGEPDEVAPSYVFLACDDSSYMTGQVLHPNGGTMVGG